MESLLLVVSSLAGTPSSKSSRISPGRSRSSRISDHNRFASLNLPSRGYLGVSFCATYCLSMRHSPIFCRMGVESLLLVRPINSARFRARRAGTAQVFVKVINHRLILIIIVGGPASIMSSSAFGRKVNRTLSKNAGKN